MDVRLTGGTIQSKYINLVAYKYICGVDCALISNRIMKFHIGWMILSDDFRYTFISKTRTPRDENINYE